MISFCMLVRSNWMMRSSLLWMDRSGLSIARAPVFRRGIARKRRSAVTAGDLKPEARCATAARKNGVQSCGLCALRRPRGPRSTHSWRGVGDEHDLQPGAENDDPLVGKGEHAQRIPGVLKSQPGIG